jgi:nucleotide-binding universal stress UspA family protein
MNLKKILLPISLPGVASRIVQHTAFLARRFRSEVIVLHVITPLSYPAGLLHGSTLTEADLRTDVVRRAHANLQQALIAELEGIAVRRVLLKGDPASAILQAARDEAVDLIAISTHERGLLRRMLLGSVTAKVIHHGECPVWTDTRADAEATATDFTVRNVLCALDLTPHSRQTLARAAKVTTALGARLTLAHVTAGVETYGPGGSHVIADWQDSLVGFASAQISRLQHEAGTDAEVIIDSGDDVPKLLSQAADRAQSNLLLIGRLPFGGHLGANGAGYAIIRESHIPVLSV